MGITNSGGSDDKKFSICSTVLIFISPKKAVTSKIYAIGIVLSRRAIITKLNFRDYFILITKCCVKLVRFILALF